MCIRSTLDPLIYDIGMLIEGMPGVAATYVKHVVLADIKQ